MKLCLTSSEPTELDIGKYICNLSPYDHLNYSRWAPVYYVDMLSLEQSAPEVYQEFVGGNFVLRKLMYHSIMFPSTKLLNGSTNYVRCPTALLVSPKLTVHEIVSASHEERGLLFLKQHSICSASEMKTNLSTTRKDNCLSRTLNYEAEVKLFVEQLERFGIFSLCRPKVAVVDEVNTEEVSGDLLSLTTNDVATEDIEDALLAATTRGAELVRRYVSTRIVSFLQ